MGLATTGALFLVTGVSVGVLIRPERNINTELRMSTVERVIDGDTIELSNGETVRYLDVDTPETVHPDKDAECYGRESTDRNKELVEGRTVYLGIPKEPEDKYGRTLAYVYTDDYFVNGELVWAGYAYARSYGTEGRLYQTLIQLERAAREDGRGIWVAAINAFPSNLYCPQRHAHAHRYKT